MASCPCSQSETGSKPSGAGRRDSRPSSDVKEYGECCGRYLDGGKAAPTAEALMRSRYTAYVLRRQDYLLLTWHPDTCPASLELEDEAGRKWLGLEIKRHEHPEPDRAWVEFVARYKVAGRAHRLHEVSRFVREAGRWLYVDGDIRDIRNG
jgi:SEC-C motif domain protein